MRAGAAALERKVRRLRPAFVAVLGVTAYRAAFDCPQATVGPQPMLGPAHVWVLPNPSGLNAHYRLDALAAEFARLHAAAALPRPRQPIATEGSVSGSGPGTG